jgi:acetyl/propionyl-CoA carboxylase alpha subunit
MSENSTFAKACEDNGIIFIGPRYETIIRMGDKIAAKKVANECKVPVVPGTLEPLKDKEEAYKWC